KKNIISLVSGLVIIGGTIGTSVALLNMMYKDTTTFTIKYSDLNKIYENIINLYGVNSKDSALTINDFKLKVEDGSIKKWILDNYRNYFVSNNSDNELNFNLSFSDNSLIFTPMRNIKFNFIYDMTQIGSNFELKDNKIYLHFDNSDFIQNQYFTLSLFNSFKTKLIQEMQKRNLVFSDFISINDEQLLNVKNWITNLFNIGDIFESVSFEPYTLTNKSNLYSMKLKSTKYYMFSWNSGISNNDEYQVFKNEVVINFTKTITLDQNTLSSLFNKVNEFIWNQRIDYYVWVEHFNQKDNKYDEFKQFVYNELNNLLNNELDSINAIGNLTLSNDNGIFSLNISSANGYDFISKSSYLNDGNIVLSNLEFYRFINFAPINFTNFFDALQNYILDNKYTIQEFANWFNTNSFKQFISQNLSNSSGELVNSELIGDVSFDPTNNLIEITPATMYQFQETTSTKNLSINAKGNIIINNLEYYSLINLTKLDTLFNAVQNKISSSQWTNEEFADFVKNNNDQIKQLISKNLFINSTDLIDLSQIDTVTISDDFKLVITLTPPTKEKYTADESKNVSLNTNTLTISNLTYFTITNFTNLSTLQRAIQEKIDTNSWTSNQFLEYVEDNQKDIIDFVSTKLSITNNGTLPSSQISRIDFINETLRISLTPPDNVKYFMEKTDNFKLSNNVLIISNFTYFTDVRLTKLNMLHNAIQSEISSNKGTKEEFEKFITDQQEDAKKLIANNLFVSEMSTISQSSIDSVTYNDGNVDITL
ncbi:MAG: hypothetical protein K2L64_03555, partial [Ureaplasma sp.]|nr:hypothetical protein [Ureaplasma sp.]